ncbi:MAG: hemerythrin domain-containing protein [Acidobacteria bacterium]|nr:hemerythrin domain-containing protein [Acidobacteriota bacterium]MCA1638874.1 hemerythrin domain-containing protein [Acidobacteriota bacterium]
MNAFEILKKDHREVDNMMAILEKAKGDTASNNSHKQTFEMMREALTIHAEAEETIVYPALEEFDETEDQAEHSYDEHAEVKSMLAQMSELEPSSDEFQTLLSELKTSVRHHVAEEEGELFPKGEELLGESELQEMGREILEFKQEGLSSNTASI